MQGSGTFGVESVFTSVVGENEKLLIIANGAYGQRMANICQHAKVNHEIIEFAENENPSAKVIAEKLDEDLAITHVAMVHSQTTSGILNDIASVAKVVKERNKIFIVDAMSSFGGVDIEVGKLGIDFIISSANKCIQGVPGFSFIIANKQLLIASKGKARSLSLDLYDQWETMNKDGKWRFTSPTHVVLAFSKAIDELLEERRGPWLGHSQGNRGAPRRDHHCPERRPGGGLYRLPPLLRDAVRKSQDFRRNFAGTPQENANVCAALV